MTATSQTETDFQRLYSGRLWSILGWDQLTVFWERVDPAAGWYLHGFGAANPPTRIAEAATVSEFIARIDALLRAEHHENYCGIVYADNLENPRLIKIYDPNNLGSSCGSSKHPPLPGWLMSRLQPDGLPAPRTVAENRKRWWRALLGDC